MTSRGVRRMRQFQIEGRQPPLEVCVRGDIQPGLHICDDQRDLDKLNRELQKIDKGFEVIFDRFTSDGVGPGHHLYRITRHGGIPSDDGMRLEFSLQVLTKRSWPDGKPKAPGMWLVNEVRARLKDHLGGTPEQQFAEMQRREAAEEKAAKVERDKPMHDAQAEFNEEAKKIVVNGKVMPELGHRKRGLKGRNAISYAGQKVAE